MQTRAKPAIRCMYCNQPVRPTDFNYTLEPRATRIIKRYYHRICESIRIEVQSV